MGQGAVKGGARKSEGVITIKLHGVTGSRLKENNSRGTERGSKGGEGTSFLGLVQKTRRRLRKSHATIQKGKAWPYNLATPTKAESLVSVLERPRSISDGKLKHDKGSHMNVERTRSD